MEQSDQNVRHWRLGYELRFLEKGAFTGVFDVATQASLVDLRFGFTTWVKLVVSE